MATQADKDNLPQTNQRRGYVPKQQEDIDTRIQKFLRGDFDTLGNKRWQRRNTKRQ